MTDASGQPISLDANVLEGTSDGLHITYQTSDGQTVTTLASSSDAADIVSKAFTTVADGSEPNVEYITMTPEEAAAAGVVAAPPEEEQVVTTSLQFDPANPSVLYTADGTPINQADLTPEEQALVQAALQQHLAEQEAEQQLAMMQESGAEEAQSQDSETTQAAVTTTDGSLVTSTSLTEQTPASEAPAVVTTTQAVAAPIADATVTSTGEQQFSVLGEGIDLASPNTSASQIVQSLADNVRKQQLQEKIQQNAIQTEVPVQKPETPRSTMRGGEGSAAGGIKYAEKIVIRQGQPQVVKVPVKKKPEIPAALANLMPKVEIGKDGSQVIRIHQSQITPNQLKALQDNPNVRLVFRPASSSRAGKVQPATDVKPKKRGRPRKIPQTEGVMAKIVSDPGANDAADVEAENDEPPAKTRCGRVSKRPVYTKDYLTPKLSQGVDDVDPDQIIDPGDANFVPNSASPTSPKKQRGRPPGPRPYKRTNSYASKIEALRNQDVDEAAVSVAARPTLTPIEQAISTRRKNRLREMLGACSEDEIMEVALPHIARVFSLWEFLVTKVEKNKMTRVFFADVYKEYECLHKYVSKLAEKYKQVVEINKATPETSDAKGETEKQDGAEKKEGADSTEKSDKEKADKPQPKTIQVTCMKLAESLGIMETMLLDAEIPLLDPEEAIGPRIMGMGHGATARRTGQSYKYENAAKPKAYMVPTGESKREARQENTTDAVAAKPVQTEATSTITQIAVPTASATEGVAMPPLKPLGQAAKLAPQDSTTEEALTPVNGDGNAPMDTEEAAPAEEQAAAEKSTPETAQVEAAAEGAATESAGEGTGTQLIQIGQGDDQQFIEVPEGYTLIQTPEGLVMSQPGTTISQGEDGTIYVTHADGTTTPLNAAQQQSVPMETVESLLSLDGQQQQS